MASRPTGRAASIPGAGPPPSKRAAPRSLAPPPTFVRPSGPTTTACRRSPRRRRAPRPVAELDHLVGDHRLVLAASTASSCPRTSCRGFQAFEELLRSRPEWVGRVVFVALAYPSREGLADYLAYRQEVEGLAARINARWSTPDWTPITLAISDDYPRSIAALARYDVLLVNPCATG